MDLNPWHAVQGIGHAIGSAASNPWVQGITAAGLAATGVGAPAAAGIMAGMGGGGALLRPGGNIGDAARGAVTGGVEGYGAGKVGAALHGAGSLAEKAGAVYGATKGAGGMGGGGDPSGGGDGGWLEGAKNFMGDHAGDGLIGAQIANSAYNQSKAGDAMGHALDTVNDQWKAGAPLREQGMAGMLNPGQGIAAKIGAIPQGANPYTPHAAQPEPGLGAASGPSAPNAPQGGFMASIGRAQQAAASGQGGNMLGGVLSKLPPASPALGPAKMGGQ